MSDDLISRKAALEILFKGGEWICDVSRSYERKCEEIFGEYEEA